MNNLNNLKDINTIDIINVSKTLWQNSCMDIFYDINNNELKYILYDIKESFKHQSFVINNVNMFTVFVTTIYKEITHIELINIIASKVFGHINQDNVDTQQYTSSIFNEGTNSAIIISDINNDKKQKGSMFTLNPKGHLTTTEESKKDGYSYEDIFELNANGEITLKEIQENDILICSDKLKNDAVVTDSYDQCEYKYNIVEINDDNDITLSEKGQVSNESQQYLVYNNINEFTTDEVNVYKTMFNINNDEVIVNDEYSHKYIIQPRIYVEQNEDNTEDLIIDDTDEISEISQKYIAINNEDMII